MKEEKKNYEILYLISCLENKINDIYPTINNLEEWKSGLIVDIDSELKRICNDEKIPTSDKIKLEDLVYEMNRIREQIGDIELSFIHLDTWRGKLSIDINADFGNYKKIPNNNLFELLEDRIENLSKRTDTLASIAYFGSIIAFGCLLKIAFFS